MLTRSGNSIRNKYDLFMDYVVKNNINIYAVIETWLKHEDEVVQAELNATGYAFKDFT